jgi:HSP20 family protein
MELVRRKHRPKLFYSPFREMEDLANRMFSGLFGDGEKESQLLEEVPAFNMYRDGDSLVIEVRVPGFKKEDINVEVEGDVLTISGKREEKEEKEEKDYYYREFRTGSFSRSVRLPSGVNSEDLQAKYQDGMLKISMPAPEEMKKSKKVNIA